MQAKEWITLVKSKAQAGEFSLAQIPLGWDSDGQVLLAHRQNRQDRYYSTCVTGGEKTQFIINTVASLLGGYAEGELSVLVLSPKREYGNLLRLKGADVTVPYLRTKNQFDSIKAFALSQIEARKKDSRTSQLLLVIDGWEEVDFLPKDNALSYLRKALEEFCGAQILCGVDFQGSIFSGFEGAFVGVEGALITADEKGKADVTFALGDCSLGVPKAISYALHF